MKSLAEKVWAVVRGLVGSTFASVGKKLVVVVVGLLLDAVRQAHPEWPLPGAELTKDLVIAFLSCHTVTDVIATLRTAVPEVAKEALCSGSK